MTETRQQNPTDVSIRSILSRQRYCDYGVAGDARRGTRWPPTYVEEKDATVRIVKTVAGFGLLVAGIAMLALPGPGWLTIAAGLAMLASEFPRALQLLDRLKAAAVQVGGKATGRSINAAKVTNRMIRSITDAMWKRDRLQMRAMDALLSVVARTRQRRTRTQRSRTTKKRR